MKINKLDMKAKRVPEVNIGDWVYLQYKDTDCLILAYINDANEDEGVIVFQENGNVRFLYFDDEQLKLYGKDNYDDYTIVAVVEVEINVTAILKR